jgi:hypothetical protein
VTEKGLLTRQTKGDMGTLHFDRRGKSKMLSLGLELTLVLEGVECNFMVLRDPKLRNYIVVSSLYE